MLLDDWIEEFEENNDTNDPKNDEKIELTVKLEENLNKSRAEQQIKSEKLIKVKKKKIFKKSERKKRILMSDLDPNELTCHECGKEFQLLYKLKLHQLIHSKEFPFHCSLPPKNRK